MNKDSKQVTITNGDLLCMVFPNYEFDSIPNNAVIYDKEEDKSYYFWEWYIQPTKGNVIIHN